MDKKQYIEREAAIASIAHEDASFVYAIERIPAADVRPVVRGKWMAGKYSQAHKCSACGEECGWKFESYYFGASPSGEDIEWQYTPIAFLSNYCPNCGADMREKS